MTTVVHPQLAARRGGVAVTSWWGRAWVRAVEEASYGAGDLAAARALARSGRIGRISVEPGRFVAAVEDERGLWAVLATLPVLAAPDVDALVEVVAAESGRMPALLAGELPHDLVEHAEEVGVELLPYGGELGSSCACDAWTDPCPHALAVMYQLGWLVDADPLVLAHLRGLSRDELLARVHSQGLGRTPAADRGIDLECGLEGDLDVAAEAALRAAALLAEAAADQADQADGDSS